MRLIYVGLVLGNAAILVHDKAPVHTVFFLFIGAFGLGLSVPKKVVDGE